MKINKTWNSTKIECLKSLFLRKKLVKTYITCKNFYNTNSLVSFYSPCNWLRNWKSKYTKCSS